MHFKARKSVHHQGGRGGLKDLPVGKIPILSLILNSNLATIIENVDLPDTARIEALLLQTSWGNWCGYSVTGGGPRLPDGGMEKLRSSFADLVFGILVCPYCEKSSKNEIAVVPDLRWHRLCMVRAYARDAECFGDDRQREWARTQLLGLDVAAPEAGHEQ